jgi:hypothetical protein
MLKTDLQDSCQHHEPITWSGKCRQIVVALATLQLDKLREGGLRKLITYDLPGSSGLGRLLTRIGELQTTTRNEEAEWIFRGADWRRWWT